MRPKPLTQMWCDYSWKVCLWPSNSTYVFALFEISMRRITVGHWITESMPLLVTHPVCPFLPWLSLARQVHSGCMMVSSCWYLLLILVRHCVCLLHISSVFTENGLVVPAHDKYLLLPHLTPPRKDYVEETKNIQPRRINKQQLRNRRKRRRNKIQQKMITLNEQHSKEETS